MGKEGCDDGDGLRRGKLAGESEMVVRVDERGLMKGKRWGSVVCERLLIAASASWRKGLSRIVERFNALQQSQGQVLVCIIVFQLSN